jgi:hypothetical protein
MDVRATVGAPVHVRLCQCNANATIEATDDKSEYPRCSLRQVAQPKHRKRPHVPSWEDLQLVCKLCTAARRGFLFRFYVVQNTYGSRRAYIRGLARLTRVLTCLHIKSLYNDRGDVFIMFDTSNFCLVIKEKLNKNEKKLCFHS